MGMDKLAYAQQFRDVIRELAIREVNRLRPNPALATVVSVDAPGGKCIVKFAGEDSEVPVKMYTVQPAAAGCVVRVEGEAGLRYVAEVLSGQSALMLRAANGNRYRITVSNTGTVTSTVI